MTVPAGRSHREAGTRRSPDSVVTDMTSEPEASRLVIDTDGRKVTTVGVIDAHTAKALLERLRALGRDDDIHLDLTGIEFIDSSGLRTIVIVHQELETAGHELRLHGVSEAADRIVEITGLADHLHIVSRRAGSD